MGLDAFNLSKKKRGGGGGGGGGGRLGAWRWMHIGVGDQ